MKLKKISLVILSVIALQSYAQELTVDADIRPRAEVLNGFGNLIPEGVDPAIFVQQRSRLNIGYTQEKFKSYLSVQDVSVWGDQPQIAAGDGNNSLSLAQAWLSFDIGDGWYTKVGRQVLSYDDQRIFGALDWALQGRFHDAALLGYKKKSFKMDVGFAFNQNGLSRQNTLFNPNNGGNVRAVFDYKAMAYVWMQKKWDGFDASLLFTNNSYQNLDPEDGQTPVDGTVNRQTFGTHLVGKPAEGLTVMANAYVQTGKFTETVDLKAYNLLMEVNYKPGKTLFGLGTEILSGDTNGGADGEITSFFPLFGTNHKFNGFMDYFYVGNHANNVGLNDFYAKSVFKTSKSSNLLLKVHYFTSAERQAADAEYHLGTEIDVVFTQKLLPFATLKVGYSHLFATDSMEVLKGVPNAADTQNWGWAMLIVKPSLIKWSPKPTMEL